MSVQRIRDIDIKSKGLFVGLYGISGQEFYLDSDLRKYNFYQQLSTYLKEEGYDKVIMYDAVNNFHSYFKNDLEQLKYSSKVSKPKETGKSRVRGSFGRRRKSEPKKEVEQGENSSLTFYSGGDRRNGFYRDQMNTRIRDYFQKEINNSKAKTAIIIKDFNNLDSNQQDSYIALFREAQQNYIINNSQNKVLIIYDSISSESLVEKFHQNRGKLMYNKFFEEIFISTTGQTKLINKEKIYRITNPRQDEIKNYLNLCRLKQNKIKFSKYQDFTKLSQLIEAEDLSLLNLYSNDISKLAQKVYNTKSGLEKLNELIGLKAVKDEINKFIKRSARLKDNDKSRYHLMFTGNPGTGKTIVAEIVAQIFRENQIIKGGKCTQKKASDFIGGYVGQTAIKTRDVCESALGGVLFIDEAYELASNDFGKEAIGELIQFMENERERFAVIFAGYEGDMQKLFKLNDGLKSRIGKIIHFPDYSSDELISIMQLEMKNYPFSIENSAFQQIKEWAGLQISSNAKEFGNGRGIVKLIPELLDLSIELDKESLTVKDIIGFLKIENKVDSMESLYELIGLNEVKDKLSSFLKRKKFIRENEIKDDSRYHLVFTGNPGTGKTIVARIVSKIYKENQIIKGGNFNQVSASDLIAGYVGQTAIKTREVCEKSLGGVLFIDEAYELASNQFGKEAVGELIQFMENERERFAVIFAGYEDDIEELLQLNEGLKSRIGETIYFPDYSAESLMEILKLKLKPLKIKLEDSASDFLIEWIKEKITIDSKAFGNGRGIEKLKTKLLDIAIKVNNMTLSENDLKQFL